MADFDKSKFDPKATADLIVKIDEKVYCSNTCR